MSTNFGRPRWWIAGAAMVAAILAVMFTVLRPATPEAGQSIGKKTLEKPSDEILAAEAEYRQAVRSIFRTWNDSNGRGVNYAELQAALLELTVPGRYRTVHLDLAVALGMLHDGLAAPDDTGRDAGRRKIQEVFAAHPWILAPGAAEETQ